MTYSKNIFRRPLVIGLSPNLTVQDVLTSIKLHFQPWKWQKGTAISEVESWFKSYFQVETAISFNAGRSALLAILKALELPKGSEVLLQAFTCVAVPNSVRWAGFTPIFVDIDETLNLDVEDAENKVTPQTRVLIVQHTFGIPANLTKISTFCSKHQLILIEDCAHALGAIYKGKLVGTYGDVAFFSFGRDKIVSSVFGGIAIINKLSKLQNQKLIEYQQSLSFPSFYWTLQQLLHPLITLPALLLYNFLYIGKVILFISQKLKLLSYPVYSEEKSGVMPREFPKKYPNALAELLLLQLQKLKATNTKRREIAYWYFEKLKGNKFILPPRITEAVYLRFNVLTSRANELRFVAKRRGIILGNWYHHIIDPAGVDLRKIGYIEGSCPQAEKASRESLNLPTYPSVTAFQIKQIVDLFNHLSVNY